jgi:hypothetical protein
LSVTELRIIATDHELREIHDVGAGLVFNTFGNKLHASSCDYVRDMTVKERKWFFSTQADAVKASLLPQPDSQRRPPP